MSTISIQNLSYAHPNKETLFEAIDLHILEGQKAALIGRNGMGKTTLFQIISSQLSPTIGSVNTKYKPYYIPQHLDIYNECNIAFALNIEDKLRAMKAILNGSTDGKDYDTLGDDWEIEQKAKTALSSWGLKDLELNTKLKSLSGGEKMKVFLSGILLHQPDIILLDEPTNHLDYSSREKLYDWINKSTKTILVISHDRHLLNLLTDMYELANEGIKYYAGNYKNYEEQKKIELSALEGQINSQKQELRKARTVQQEVAERRQRLDARGKEKTAKKGLPKIVANARRGNAQRTTAGLKGVHEDKIDDMNQSIVDLQKTIDATKDLRLVLESSNLHKGKILVEAKEINFSYAKEKVWNQHLNFCIRSGERILLKGTNGSGKTTLLKMITKELTPTQGNLALADLDYLYLDQEYSLIDNTKTVYEQAQSYNTQMPEHEVKMNLARSQFPASTWDKSCNILSGGERMKLAICSLIIAPKVPDLLIFDEPTNNIDLYSLNILSSAIQSYKGSLLLVSHDKTFIAELSINYEIDLDSI